MAAPNPPLAVPPAEPAALSRICTASRHLHRHYRMRRKRRAARRRPPSGGPQFNVKTLGTRKCTRYHRNRMVKARAFSLTETEVRRKLIPFEDRALASA